MAFPHVIIFTGKHLSNVSIMVIENRYLGNSVGTKAHNTVGSLHMRVSANNSSLTTHSKAIANPKANSVNSA